MRTILFAGFLLLARSAMALVNDSAAVGTYTLALSSNQEIFTIDTSSNELEAGDVTTHFGSELVHLGNLAQPAHYLYPNRHLQVGHKHGFDAMTYQMLLPENTKFFAQQRPYSELMVGVGFDQRFMLEAYHHQQLSRIISIGAHAHRAYSNGYYNRQKSSVSDFEFHTVINSKNERLRLTALFISNNIKQQISGGLTYDIFSDDFLVQRNVYDAELIDALGHITSYHALLNTSWQLTPLADSLNETKRKWLVGNRIAFAHYYNRFFDHSPTDSFYSNAALPGDTVGMYYTQRNWNYGFYLQYKSQAFWLDAGAYHDYNDVMQQHTFKAENDLLLKASAGFTIGKTMQLKINAEAIPLGSHLADGMLQAELKFVKSVMKGFRVEAFFESAKPARALQQLNSSAVEWNFEFKPVKSSGLIAGYKNEKWKLDASLAYYLHFHYVYADSSRLPVQTTDKIELIQAHCRKDIVLAKYVHFDNEANISWSANKQLSYPLLRLKHSVYFSKNVFKGAMLGSYGITVDYNTDYYLKGYDPLSQLFYEQREWKQVFYPRFSVFIRAKIKTVRLYLQVNNVLEGLLTPKGTYGVNKYPTDSRNFTAGIAWRFLD